MKSPAVNLTYTPTILPSPRSRQVPLSFAQQRLWFLDQLEPHSPFYNLPVAVRMSGRLNLAALERTFAEIIRRHESLRTTFAHGDEHPVQIVHPPQPFTLDIEDLSELAHSEREDEAERRAREASCQPFDLGLGPLLRIKLLRVGEEEHVALLLMHHIIADEWSMGVLVQEITTLYEAFSNGLESPLPELTVQYGEYAMWQREWLTGDVLDVQLEYWKRKLGGMLPVLELPTDYVRPARQTYHGAGHSFVLPAGLSSALIKLSHRQRVTPFILLLAAWQVLLSRYTGQEDIIVGTPVANRNRAGIEPLIGFFVNTLALRADLSSDPSFLELLRRVRETCLEAYTHQDVPFEKLVDELQPKRDVSRSPLFQTTFSLKHGAQKEWSLSGIRMRNMGSEPHSVQFDLQLAMSLCEGSLTGRLDYNTDLFAEATIERMSEHFKNLLKGILAAPEQRLSRLPLLCEAERRQLLVEWNQTARDFPGDKCLHELFEEQAARTPDAVALTCEDQQLTYAELDARANQLAHHLRGMGVGADALVGMCLERSPEIVLGLLGILKAGGAYVSLDPDYPAARLSFMMKDAGISVLVTQQGLLERVPEHDAVVVCLDADAEAISRCRVESIKGAVQPAHLAYAIYTSGSTGQPKGVLVEHRQLVSTLCASQAAFGFKETDVVLCMASFSFDISLFELLSPLLVGGRCVMVNSRDVLDRKVAERVLREVTVIHAVPALMRYFIELYREQRTAEHPARINKVFVGGDAVAPDLLDQIQDAFPDADACVLYGPTEATIICAHYAVTRNLRLPHQMIGRPLSNVKLRLCDRQGNPVPVGVAGEIYIGGMSVARGYLNRAELTREKFVFVDRERYYRSGDLGRYLPDGKIVFLGRIDGQVKIRGNRVEVGEIESALTAHAAISEAAVLVRADAPGEKHLVAYVVPQAGAHPTTSELSGYVGERLPDYMIPAAFVRLEKMPLTVNGKIDRGALPWPVNLRPELEDAYVAPQSALEKQIAEVWQRVLGLDGVGVMDNFFEVGGNSLSMMRVHHQLPEVVRREMSLVDLFRHPTISSLAGYLGQQQSTASNHQRAQERARKEKEVTERQRRLAQIRRKA